MSFPFNLTIDNTSPILTYQPYGDGIGLSNGWTTWYSELGFIDSPGVIYGDTGAGESYHITSLPGANVSLAFNGTGVTLFGMANCTFEVMLDGQLTNSTSSDVKGTLFSRTNLTMDAHVITLISGARRRSTQQLAFDSAFIEYIADNASFLGNRAQINATNTSLISYSSDWSQTQDNGVPVPGLPEVPFYQTSTQDSMASFEFMGQAVELHGELNYGHGQFIVSLDSQNTTLNGSSVWKVPDTILFFQDGLDENQIHTLNLTNLSGDNETLSFNWVTVYNYNSVLTATNGTTNGTSANATSSGSTGGPTTTITSSSAHNRLKLNSVFGSFVLAMTVGLFL